MTISTTMLASDFAAMIADLPTSVTIGSNAACNAVVTDITDCDTLELAGVSPEHGVTVHVPVASLTVTPFVGVKVVIGSISYRCTTLTTTPDGIEYILGCEAIQK